jgi:aminopeptidase
MSSILKNILPKYAELLVNYCLELKKGDRLFIHTTTLAEPLVKEVWRYAIRAGAFVETELDFEGKQQIFMQEASEAQLKKVSDWEMDAMSNFDAYLSIRAPFSLKQTEEIDQQKLNWRNEALAPLNKIYFERIADRRLKRCLCQYPTQTNADEAGMTLEAYQHFVFDACNLFEDQPMESWLKVRAEQQKIVDFLNTKSEIQYKGTNIDITFNTKGRTWINSDGRNNMPSGEVFTSPIEDSVNGHIHFSFPGIHGGRAVEGVTLWVKDGYIERWDAQEGKDYLDQIFKIPGTRRFGEAAIGTNYKIQQITKNILFDEKIGGSVHMAIGQSYLQCGGKNESSVHWDMITDMKNGGEIYADGELIYKNGVFTL